MGIRSLKSAKQRRIYVEKTTYTALSNIGNNDDIENEKIHCENCIGAVTVPLGIAGPLVVETEKARKTYYIPLATTEGALVASVNRGCKAITSSKGVKIFTEKKGVTRGPVFFTDSLEKAFELKKWILAHTRELAYVAEKTSNHLTYMDQKIQIIGSLVYIRFLFDTQDAMGMNMVTIATEHVALYIEKKTGVKCGSIASNFDIDKKPAWLNFIEGRGVSLWAQALITDKVIKEILKTNAKKIYNVWLHKCLMGSAISGSLGFNAHFANIVAAFYIATGQDVAHTVEGSLGMTTCEEKNDGSLLISLYLPSLMVGTVGGGTKLKTQQEALSIMGAKTSGELAGVLGGAVLAGELSLLASLAEGSLAFSHKKLGR